MMSDRLAKLGKQIDELEEQIEALASQRAALQLATKDIDQQRGDLIELYNEELTRPLGKYVVWIGESNPIIHGSLKHGDVVEVYHYHEARYRRRDTIEIATIRTTTGGGRIVSATFEQVQAIDDHEAAAIVRHIKIDALKAEIVKLEKEV